MGEADGGVIGALTFCISQVKKKNNWSWAKPSPYFV